MDPVAQRHRGNLPFGAVPAGAASVAATLLSTGLRAGASSRSTVGLIRTIGLEGAIKSMHPGRSSLVFALVKKQEQRERHKENHADIPKNARIGFQRRLGVNDAVQGLKSPVMGL